MIISKVNGAEATPELLAAKEAERKAVFDGMRDGYQVSGSFFPDDPNDLDRLTLLLDREHQLLDGSRNPIGVPLRAFDTRLEGRTNYSLLRGNAETLRVFSPTRLFLSDFHGVRVVPFSDVLDFEGDFGLVARLRRAGSGELELRSWRVREVASDYDSAIDETLREDPDNLSFGCSGLNGVSRKLERYPATFEALGSVGSDQFLGSIFPGMDIDPASFVRVESRTLLNGNAWYRVSFGLAQSTLLPERGDADGRVVREFKDRYLDMEIDPNPVKRQPLVLVGDNSQLSYAGTPS